MNQKNVIFSLVVVAILVVASFSMFLPQDNSKNKIIDSVDLDNNGIFYTEITSDAEYSCVENGDYSVYTKSAYYNYSFEDGLETAALDNNTKEMVRMDTTLTVPNNIVGKSHAEFSFYDEKNNEVECVELDFMSTVTPDLEFDIIMFVGDKIYSAKQIVSNEGIEECAIWFVWLGLTALELLGIVITISVAVSVVVLYSDSTGWGAVYTVKAGDGSQANIDLIVNRIDKLLRLNNNWDELTAGNSTFYNSPENQDGLNRLAFIIDQFVYMSVVAVNDNIARTVIKANKNSLQNGADVYTKKFEDADKLTKGIAMGGGANVQHPAHDYDYAHNHYKPGIFFDHFHALAKAKAAVKMQVHAFYGAPVVR